MCMSISKISKINIVKIMVLSKVIYRFSRASIKLISFIAELRQTTLKFIRNKKIPQITKIMLNKKNSVREIMIPNLRIYYRTIVIKTMYDCTKQICRAIKQKLKTKMCIHITSFNFWQRCQEINTKEKKNLQQMVKLDAYIHKNELIPVSIIPCRQN